MEHYRSTNVTNMKERQRNKPGQPRKECSNCGKPIEKDRLGKQRYCLACHAEYMRTARKLAPKVYGHYRSRPVDALLAELKRPEPVEPRWGKIVALAMKVEKSKL